MEFFEVIEKRASVRGLQPVTIGDADLEKILDAGRRAPSGMNRQPVSFIVIKNPQSLQRLAAAQACLASVSVAIAVVADPALSNYWLEDVAAATENMVLAITALGYASVWIEGTLLRKEAQLKKTLEIPEEMRLMVVLPVGKAEQVTPQAPKRALREAVHWERYGNRKS